MKDYGWNLDLKFIRLIYYIWNLQEHVVQTYVQQLFCFHVDSGKMTRFSFHQVGKASGSNLQIKYSQYMKMFWWEDNGVSNIQGVWQQIGHRAKYAKTHLKKLR